MGETMEYKCPCCDGAIVFDSSTQKMKCPYCGSAFDTDTLKAYDEELKKAKPEEMEWQAPGNGEWQGDEAENMAVFTCQSCGGEIVGDANTAATTCVFCGNPVVMGERLAGDLRPDSVIPFKLDKAAAKTAFFNHLKGKRLLPKVFKDENHIDEIKGIYVPFWLFDSDVEADVQYNATKTRVWSDSDYNYTETSHFLVTREGNIAFERVPVDGSTKMADDLMESVEPFDYSDAVDFQTAYLAGYFADKYDVDAEKSIGRANQRIKASTEEAFADTVKGYASVLPKSSSIRLSKGEIHYALYPIWLLNTTWNDQKFVFAMNGQTGKFAGNLPLDKGASRRWFWGITGAVTVVAFLLGLLLGI